MQQFNDRNCHNLVFKKLWLMVFSNCHNSISKYCLRKNSSIMHRRVPSITYEKEVNEAQFNWRLLVDL